MKVVKGQENRVGAKVKWMKEIEIVGKEDLADLFTDDIIVVLLVQELASMINNLVKR